MYSIRWKTLVWLKDAFYQNSKKQSASAFPPRFSCPSPLIPRVRSHPSLRFIISDGYLLKSCIEIVQLFFFTASRPFVTQPHIIPHSQDLYWSSKRIQHFKEICQGRDYFQLKKKNKKKSFLIVLSTLCVWRFHSQTATSVKTTKVDFLIKLLLHEGL